MGSMEEAAKAYTRALALVTNDSERRFLERRLREVQSPVISSFVFRVKVVIKSVIESTRR